jgi:hypothetical protein
MFESAVNFQSMTDFCQFYIGFLTPLYIYIYIVFRYACLHGHCLHKFFLNKISDFIDLKKLSRKLYISGVWDSNNTIFWIPSRIQSIQICSVHCLTASLARLCAAKLTSLLVWHTCQRLQLVSTLLHPWLFVHIYIPIGFNFIHSIYHLQIISSSIPTCLCMICRPEQWVDKWKHKTSSN